MCVTIVGKIGACASGAAIVPPRLTEAVTPSIAPSIVTLPPVLPVISSASSSGTPAAVSEESVRDQRATETCWTIVPIFIGTRRRKRSHWGRPQELFFHFRKVIAEPAVSIASSHQYLVTACDMPTETFVIEGSSPPNCLKTPSKTGTRKGTRASITPTAK